MSGRNCIESLARGYKVFGTERVSSGWVMFSLAYATSLLTTRAEYWWFRGVDGVVWDTQSCDCFPGDKYDSIQNRT